MLAWIPVRIRIGVKLPLELDVERGFFLGFSSSGFLQGFTVVDESSRDGPSVRGILPLDQNDSFLSVFPLDFDDDIHGRDRISVFFHRNVQRGSSSRDPLLSGRVFRNRMPRKAFSADKLEFLFQLFEFLHDAAVLELAVGKHGRT